MTAEEHIYDLLPAYALGCLDEEEAIPAAEHLAGCQECQAALRQYQQTVEALPLAAVQRPLPPQLKEKLAARIPLADMQASSVSRAGWRARLAGVSQSAALALVSLALVVALGISNLYLWGRLQRVESQSQLAMRTVTLSGTEFSPQASGMLVISHDGEYGTLVVDGLPKLGDAHQYQLWLIQDGQRASGGLFNVDDSGYGALWVSSPAPLSQYSAFGVTIEPSGGSPGPTGEKVLGGDL